MLRLEVFECERLEGTLFRGAKGLWNHQVITAGNEQSTKRREPGDEDISKNRRDAKKVKF